MRNTLIVFGLTLAFLAVLDGFVALGLNWSERSAGLVRYFEFGRSVPGKLARWQETPGARGNLFDVAWPADIIALSQAQFSNEEARGEPVIRSYGMSFVNNILRSAVKQDPSLQWDNHSGPSAPPNFTYALFERDRGNRHAGDIIVFGILSSSVHAMAAMSNSTWVFEQPAPFTYPVYWPAAEYRLRAEMPLINSAQEQRALAQDSDARRAWHNQLEAEDAFYGSQTFGFVWADHSPFARLVRRSLAKAYITRKKTGILTGAYPYAEVLERMISEFASKARVDGQTPVVILVQSRDPRDPDLLTLAQPILNRDDIPYLATAEHFDPRDPSGFLSDGHYIPSVDEIFARAFLEHLN